MGYFKEAAKGVTWMAVYRVFYRILGIVRLGVIAHMLTPFGLGVFGVATITLALVEILTETGINVFLIQRKDDVDQYLNTAWVISIFRGAFISFLIFVSAPVISLFFNSPESQKLLYLVSLVPLLRGFINPAIVKFQKNLLFYKEFTYKLLVYIADSAAAVIGVFITRSPMGLVYGLIAGAVFEIIYTFMVARPTPKFILDISYAKKIIGQGKWVTLFGIFDYLFTQADNIIVGRILGVAPLGIYQNAYKISTSPLTEVGDVFFRVTFPVFSKISGESDRLKRAFLKNTLVNAMLMIPFGILIFVLAELIVKYLLGPGWEGAVPVVRLLSILGIVRGIAGSTNSLLVARERQKYSAISTMVSTAIMLSSIVPLIKIYGIMGAGMAAILGTVVSLPFTIFFIIKTLK
jgi:lipopolysaccharide exporter